MAMPKVQRAMDRRGASQPPRSRAFFLELIINILIFALCAVVILQVFAEAKTTTDKSAALTTLTLSAETLAETYKASDGELEGLTLVAPDGATSADASEEFAGEFSEDSVLTFYYNGELELSQADEAQYSLVLAPVAGQSTLVNTIEITGFAGDAELFRFEVTQYQLQEGR